MLRQSGGRKPERAGRDRFTQQRGNLRSFVAAGLALVLSSLIGVLFGEALTRLVPLRYIQIGAGVAFVLIGGVLLLVGGRKG